MVAQHQSCRKNHLQVVVSIGVVVLAGCCNSVLGELRDTYSNRFPHQKIISDCASLCLEVNKWTEGDSEFQDSRFSYELFKETEGGVEVLIASVNSVNNRGTTYVAFRGSDEAYDWKVNFDAWLGPFGFENGSLTDGMEVHQGFNREIFGDEDFIYDIVSVLKNHPSDRIVITGHSKGGAEALLFGVYLATIARDYRKVQVITFGAPMVGDEDFVSYVNTMKNIRVWRFVLKDDPVPRLPPHFYEHAGHLVQMEDDGAKAYYRQKGDKSLDLLGVPDGWEDDRNWVNVKEVHLMKHYLKYMTNNPISVDNFEEIVIQDKSTEEDCGLFGRLVGNC